MKKEFKGRNVVAGTVQAQSVVSRKGMNTLATFQKSILAKKKTVFGSDQNNEDLYKKEITGKALSSKNNRFNNRRYGAAKRSSFRLSSKGNAV